MYKIAHVVTSFNPGTGVKADVSELMLDQRQRGWRPELICGRHIAPALLQEMRQQGFSVHQISSLRKYVHPADDLKSLFALARLFKRQKFDIVHTHLAKAGIIGRLAARLAKVKIIIHTVYGASFAPTLPQWNYHFFLNLEKVAGIFTTKIIFISKDIRDAYIEAGVCSAEKSVIIYPGKDLSPFLAVASLSPEERQARRQKAGIDDQTIVLGNVSRIVPWKGHEFAIQTLHEIKKEFPQTKLIIVGAAILPSEQTFLQKLVHQVKNLNLTEDVIFTGWQDNTPYYYSIFDIYIITSMPFEALSLSVMEAYASGLPVVGFKWHGARDIMGDKAKVVAVKDVPSLIQALKQEIARLPESRRQRGNNLAEINKLQDRHTYVRMKAETGDLYKKLLG